MHNSQEQRTKYFQTLSITPPAIAPGVIDAIREELATRGWVVLPRESGTREEFRQLCQQLGPIIETGNIQVLERPVSYATGADALPLHTDAPSARYIAWYCVEQQSGKAIGTDLLDVGDFQGRLSVATQAELRRMHYIDSQHTFEGIPVIFHNGEKEGLQYAGWFSPRLEDPKRLRAWNELQEYIRNREALKFEVVLSAGEKLIIDNYRMLHGRAKLDVGSKRHLVRHWIGGCASLLPDSFGRQQGDSR